MAIKRLYISKDVTAGTEETDTFIPANNKKVYIHEMHGSAAFSKNSAVKLVWDYGGANKVIWSIKGDGGTPQAFRGEKIGTGNGVKVVALVLDNGETSNVLMTGISWLRVED